MKKIDYLIEKERKKCARLDALYDEYEHKKVEFEESILMCSEYRDNNNHLLRGLEKEANDLKSIKEENEKNQKMIKKQKEAEIKLAQLKQEHFSIKQIYNELLDKKKNLQLFEVKLIDENNQYKETIDEITKRLQERKQEKIDLEDALHIKIDQTIKLRQFYENQKK